MKFTVVIPNIFMMLTIELVKKSKLIDYAINHAEDTLIKGKESLKHSIFFE